VRFGSWLLVTIWGRCRESHNAGGMGAQIRPEVWRIMKAIFSVVMSWAAMMRSPSFSREGSSRTIMNSPLPRVEVREDCGVGENGRETYEMR
jgi:hypothetical protein